MKLRFREAALADLERIFDFGFDQFGPDAAMAYRTGFEHVFALLERNPALGPISDIVGKDVRSFAFKRHRIYYRIEEPDVVIVRILHMAQDRRRNLKP